MTGRLWPIVGLGTCLAKIRVNLGGNLSETPFKYDYTAQYKNDYAEYEKAQEIINSLDAQFWEHTQWEEHLNWKPDAEITDHIRRDFIWREILKKKEREGEEATQSTEAEITVVDFAPS